MLSNIFSLMKLRRSYWRSQCTQPISPKCFGGESGGEKLDEAQAGGSCTSRKDVANPSPIEIGQ